MARKTKEEAQETRNRIVQAAADVFWEKGVANASLENIAERAGVTRGAIYWHFKNKVDIFEALHEELHSSFHETILADMENDHPEPLTQLEELCVALLLDIDRDAHKKKILSVFILRCDYTGEMEYFLQSQNQKKCSNAELFFRYFERAIAKGHLPADADPCILTTALFCFMSGIIHEYLRCPAMFNLKEQASPLCRQFFKGVGRA